MEQIPICVAVAKAEGLCQSFILRHITKMEGSGWQATIDDTSRRHKLSYAKPAGVVSPKLSRILPQKGAVSSSPAWLKKFEPTVIQNPMTIRRFFNRVIEKYLGKESNSK
ncbi:hypothetical protein AVEN_59268-1 [Araneus ventricosus]|uniref:Uncharacterized protein n=1 Tax=Araneus ventricosus TaxID=182803 RepID=A0A4Y2LX64_ARAVE|nr:hypothetical protein AVEN_59268-1 [Araneus ventricosus]